MRFENRTACIRVAVVAALSLAASVARAPAADHIKIGTLLTTGSVPQYIAIEKGYFAAEGIEAELVPFDAGQPVAVATVAGSIDFGAAGVTSALYTLAAEGALRIIGGGSYDRPNFHAAGILASNAAYAAGLTSLKLMAGHSVALTQVGSTYHYAVAIVAEKYGVDMKSMRALPLQSFANVASALSGGQADTGVLTAAGAAPILAAGNAKLLAWVGEETPWQVTTIWTSGKTANDRRDLVERFLRAMRKGAQDFTAAFVGPGGTRRDGPMAPEIVAIIQKYVHLKPEQIEANVGYVDPELRIDTKDIERQLAWYRAQGMLKTPIRLDQVLDSRYAVALPGS